jgi:hypothetical protein
MRNGGRCFKWKGLVQIDQDDELRDNRLWREQKKRNEENGITITTV